jgi:hypothetical protein
MVVNIVHGQSCYLLFKLLLATYMVSYAIYELDNKSHTLY